MTATQSAYVTVADPGGGGVRGFSTHTPQRFFFFACQYMKIPADLDPRPTLEEFRPRTPHPHPRSRNSHRVRKFSINVQ